MSSRFGPRSVGGELVPDKMPQARRPESRSSADSKRFQVYERFRVGVLRVHPRHHRPDFIQCRQHGVRIR
jgi:hypothetical protein